MLACADHTVVWLSRFVIVYFVVSSGFHLLKLRFLWQNMNAEYNDKNFPIAGCSFS